MAQVSIVKPSKFPSCRKCNSYKMIYPQGAEKSPTIAECIFGGAGKNSGKHVKEKRR